MSTLRLADRVAVITGGASGIGASIAKRFASEGARVVIGDRDAEAGPQAARSLSAPDNEVVFVPCDVAQASDARNLIDTTLEKFERLDVLVNNAGVWRAGDLAQMSIEDWDHVIEVNLRGTFLCSRAAIAPMLARKRGAIVNFSSRAGIRGQPGCGAYCASKAGVISLTQSLAAEVKEAGVRVNAICPGMVRTSMGAQAGVIPGARWIEPCEIADVALYLASDESSAITGAAIDAFG